ncbi:MAG: phage shock protein C [Sphingobacteriales bacterium]|jgi:phage shock protein C
MIQRIYNFFEQQAFGVCSTLGRYIGIPVNKIRMFFIYASFIALGSPVLIYLTLAFIIDLKKYFRISFFDRYKFWSL